MQDTGEVVRRGRSLCTLAAAPKHRAQRTVWAVCAYMRRGVLGYETHVVPTVVLESTHEKCGLGARFYVTTNNHGLFGHSSDLAPSAPFSAFAVVANFLFSQAGSESFIDLAFFSSCETHGDHTLSQ